MSPIITKSDFLKYKECSSFFSFWKNKPAILDDEKIDPFIERLKTQGYEVELFARGLYPEASLVAGTLDQASSMTTELIHEGNKALFQASFMADDLFASCDVLIWNELFQGWDIIEIKSSTDKNKKKKEHIIDAAFQRIVAQRAGLKIVNVYLVELNKDYYKNGEIDRKGIFNQTEITTECIELEQQINADIIDAKKVLKGIEPTECSCRYKGRSKHCRAFKHLYPTVPDYSIYDLRAIGRSKKVLHQLVDGNYIELNSIPDNIKLDKTHEKQHWVHVSQETIFDREKISEQLNDLQYPLYFLDYETLACGIPKYDKTYPYQQTVFQYSLHILEKDGSVQHKEFIHRDPSTPVHIVANKLREDIGDEGQVIVWNKSFEGKCNTDLPEMNLGLKEFLLGLNNRIFDLMEIFMKMEFLHDRFKGSYSIKNVLPVMCPDLSYDDMEVSNGAEAVVEYEQLIFGDVDQLEKEKKFKALLEYCKLDTWAMVRIFQELQKMINKENANILRDTTASAA